MLFVTGLKTRLGVFQIEIGVSGEVDPVHPIKHNKLRPEAFGIPKIANTFAGAVLRIHSTATGLIETRTRADATFAEDLATVLHPVGICRIQRGLGVTLKHVSPAAFGAVPSPHTKPHASGTLLPSVSSSTLRGIPSAARMATSAVPPQATPRLLSSPSYVK